jgi:protein gp37
MGENSSISWCDHTMNPWIGCTKVSPACDGCYAEAMMGEVGRYKRVLWGAPGKGEGTRIRTVESNWARVRKWDRQAAAKVEAWRTNPFAREETPKPATFVFCASLADVFDNQVDPTWRADLFRLIGETQNLTWLLLTKRPQNILKLGPNAHLWPRNAAIGCTVVTQEEADRDVPVLLAAKAALKPAFAFLSMEPLLGPVEISAYLWPTERQWRVLGRPSPAEAVDWVIAGGETDQGAHKARPARTRSGSNLCATSAPRPACPSTSSSGGSGRRSLASPFDIPLGAVPETVVFPPGLAVSRIGKRNDPGTLDGVKHDARPEVQA